LSLTLALKGKDGIVLAADSRITKGYTLDGPKTVDDSEKFVRLNSDCGTSTYGLSDIGNAGIAMLKDTISKSESIYDSIDKILDESMKIFSRVSSKWSQDHSGIMRRDRDVGFIIAGFERKYKEFKIFNLQSPDFEPVGVKTGCLLAGQWHVAKFYVKRLFAENLPVDILKKLAVLLLNETMAVEKTVGGNINLASLTEKDGFTWISEDDVRSIIEKNSKFVIRFQEYFYSSLLNAAGE